MRISCNIKKNEDYKKDKLYEKLIEIEKTNKNIVDENNKIKNENSKLKKKMEKIEKKMEKGNKTTNNINNGIINNNNINNIVLIGCGNEDISKIDRNDILKGIKNGFYSTVKLTDAIHFNPKYPEYHNVYISNMKDKYAMMYDGTNWTLVTKIDLIDKLYDEKKSFIEENLEDFYDALTKGQKNSLERWMDIDDDHMKVKEIKEKIKLLLYNKRKIPLKIKEIKIIEKLQYLD
jgi:hypothetical protein